MFTKRLRQRHIGVTGAWPRLPERGAMERGRHLLPGARAPGAAAWREQRVSRQSRETVSPTPTAGGCGRGCCAPRVDRERPRGTRIPRELALAQRAHRALPLFPVPWLWSPQPRDSRPFKSSSRPCRDACQGEEGQAALPAPTWSPKPADRRGDGKVRGVLGGFSRKQQKAQPGGPGYTEESTGTAVRAATESEMSPAGGAQWFSVDL